MRRRRRYGKDRDADFGTVTVPCVRDNAKLRERAHPFLSGLQRTVRSLGPGNWDDRHPRPRHLCQRKRRRPRPPPTLLGERPS